MLDKKVPWAQIKSRLKMSEKSIAKVSRGEHLGKAGRPKKLSAEHVAFVEVNSETNACLTDQQLANMVQETFNVSVSDTTILRTRAQLGFRFRPPKVKQALSACQKEARMTFCAWVVENRNSLPPIVFSDESRFCQEPDNRWRHIRRGQLDESCFVTRKKFPKGIMVWGAISLDYRSPLIECSNSVNADEYQRIVCASKMVDDMNGHYGVGKWLFMQDGAPCHTSFTTTQMLYNKKVCLLPGWPTNSPDLNPIEMLWGVMKRRANWEGKSHDQMLDYVRTIWGQTDVQTINQLVLSFVNRCELVLKLGGESITPYLKGRYSIAGPLQTVAQLWRDEEDACIKQFQERQSPQWSKIALDLGKDVAVVRHRARQLADIDRNRRIQEYHPLPPIQVFLEAAYGASS